MADEEQVDRAVRAMLADDLVTLRSVLDDGLDPNAVGDHGMSLLYYAVDIEGDTATQGEGAFHADATSLLVARGANPLVAADDGLTPYAVAQSYGHWLALEIFDSLRRDAGPPQ